MQNFEITSVTVNYQGDEINNVTVNFTSQPNGTTAVSTFSSASTSQIRRISGSILVTAQDYESTNGDIASLKELIKGEVSNFINGQTSSQNNAEQQAQYLGGGWYQLPSGEKVQGQEEVDNALNQSQSTQENVATTENTTNSTSGTQQAQTTSDTQQSETSQTPTSPYQNKGSSNQGNANNRGRVNNANSNN